MSITEAREKCKIFISGRIPRDVLIIVVLVLASSFSFGLGYMAGLDAGREKGSGAMFEVNPPSPEVMAGTAGQVVAAKTGTKYYLPSCSGADRISEANKIWFNSAELAATAGYTPAANCPGL